MKSFELSDSQMDDSDDEVPPSETATAEAQPVVSSLDAVAVTSQAGDPVPAFPRLPTVSIAGTACRIGNL